MSTLRSRNGGSLIWTTFSRKYRSCRNFPSLTTASRSRFVAAMTRALIGICSVDPTGLISFSCRARNNLACRKIDSSPISSRKMVPSLAVWSRPSFDRSAPVKAPLMCPKSSDSINVGVRAEQSTGTNAFSRRNPSKCMARATSSFPVPVSPRSRIGDVFWLTLSIKL